MIQLNKLKAGDQVGIISPSAGLPGLFPHVYELGIKRLQEEFGLNPIEYPTTREMNSSLEDRARDIMAAFADKNNKAVLSSIGGSDQINLIKFLDKQIFLDNPKPFFGYSDNTHLHNFLWQLGIPAYYGGAIMTQFGWQIKMQDFTKHYLQLALFETGEYELKASDMYNDEGLQWADPETLNMERKMEPNAGWVWNGDSNAAGILWGGCLESMSKQFELNLYLPDNEQLKGKVLFLETSEEMPTAEQVEQVLTTMGERGWLENFSAVLVGRPKAWHFTHPFTAEQKQEYTKAQQEVFTKVFRKYNSTAPLIQNMDFGHTDPQIVLPNGQMVRINSTTKQIFANY